MVHIILLILKIIGYILLALIGVIVILLVTILLAPIKYQIEGSIDNSVESIKSHGRITWLCRLVHIYYTYENKVFHWRGRVAWIHLDEENQSDSPGYTKTEKKSKQSKATKKVKQKPKEKPEKKTEEVIELKVQQRVEEKQALITEQKSNKKPKNKTEKVGKLKKISDKIKFFYHKFLDFLKNMKYTFERFCDTINNIWKQKEIVEKFITNETHKDAFIKCKDQLLFLLKCMKPRRVKVKGEFGFEDPSKTGQSVAVMSMFQLFYGKEIQVRPNFEEQVYLGEALIKGKIRIIYFVIVAFRLILDKKVRVTFKHASKLEFFNKNA